jgi:hypothetical protein
MPQSFKGTQVELARVTIDGRVTGPIVKIEVQFCNKDGVVHAFTRHELEPTVDPRIASATKQLLDAVKSWAEHVHYEDAAGTARKVTTGGIAESLRGSADPDDEVGGQG